MNRNEYLRMLDTEPATRGQVGAIHGEFRRLGLAGGRPARLAAIAALLGRGSLSSSTNLTMGEAGHVIKTLRGLGDAGDLTAAVLLPRPRARSGASDWRRELAATAAAWQQLPLLTH